VKPFPFAVLVFLPLFSWAGEKVIESGPECISMVELFTSEGCSSCPAAEDWFNPLKDRKDLWQSFVPVAWHVDYWDGLGWPDPWAKASFSQRQRAYAKGWGSDRVYTPCFALNGREWAKVKEEVLGTKGAKTGVLKVETRGNEIRILWRPEIPTVKPVRAFYAPLLCGIVSEVKAGENAGRKLTHEFVAREVVAVELVEKGGVWIGRGENRDFGEALAVWVKMEGQLEPLQATGGWMKKN